MKAKLLGLLGAVLLCTAFGQAPARADTEYAVGPEDVLSVSVWEHPELSRTLAVRTDGSVTFPPLGDVPAAGKPTSVLARDLENRIYNTLRLTTQVTVTVVAFNSQKVYLAGQVTSPGRYSFETLPNLVDLLGMTGGINPQADLTQVKILRRSTTGNTTLNVDLSRAVQAGDMSNVPPLQTGDLVLVPGSGGVTGQTPGGAVVYVLGEVARPGPYNAVAGMNLLGLLSVAGGYSPRADLGNVEVLAGGYRINVDLNKEIEAGHGGLTLRAGDTVVVPASSLGAAGTAWAVTREALGVSRDVINLFLIRNVLGH